MNGWQGGSVGGWMTCSFTYFSTLPRQYIHIAMKFHENMGVVGWCDGAG